MFAVFLMALLLGIANADNTIRISCSACSGGQLCITASGGPFDSSRLIQTNFFSSCSDLQPYYEFHCNSNCYNCLIQAGGFSSCFTPSSTIGTNLNRLYRISIGISVFSSSKYDWCNCPSSFASSQGGMSTAATAGGGSAGGVCILLICCYLCCRERRKE